MELPIQLDAGVDEEFEVVEVAESGRRSVAWRWAEVARRLGRLAFKRRQWSTPGVRLREIEDRGRHL